MNGDLSGTAVLLVAHGSSVASEANDAARQQAAELRRRGLFARVEAGYWRQEPGVCALAESLTERCVCLVPLMISDGYFSGQVVPRALGFATAEGGGTVRVRRRGSQTWIYTQAIGTHPRMAEVLVRHAEEVVRRYPFPRAPQPFETALFVAGHGTERHPQSREAIEQQAERIRALGVYGEVHAVMLEESPQISQVYDLTRLRSLVVAPFFVGDGQHTAEDIPVLLGDSQAQVRERLSHGLPPWRNPTERRGKRVWYATGIGNDPAVAEIIIDRVREAARIS